MTNYEALTQSGVPVALTDWKRLSRFSFRIWESRGVLRLFRLEKDSRFYGGIQILSVPVENPLALEWFQEAQAAFEQVQECRAAIAAARNA